MTNALRRALSCVLLFLMAPSLAVMLAIAAAPPAHAQTVRIATPSTLAAELKAAGASCGNTVVIASTMTVPRVSGFKPACRVTLAVNPGAKATMSGPGYWTGIEAIDFTGPGDWGFLKIVAGRNLSFTGFGVVGPVPPQLTALTLDQVSGCRVEGVRFAGVWKGLVLQRTSDCVARANTFTGISSDAINIAGGWKRVTIEGNTITAFVAPAPGDHPDGIQAFTAAGNVADQLIIRGNVVEAQFGQGGFLQNPGKLAVTNTTIELNKIVAGLVRGLSLEGTMSTGAIVRQNDVATYPGSANQSLIFTGSTVTRCGNTVAGYTRPDGRVMPGSADAPCNPPVGP